MVNQNKIDNLLMSYFHIHGDHTIDPETGIVDVQGHVSLDMNEAHEKLPVQFGHVQGNFQCYDNKLKTLVGAPHTVGGDFFCNYNQLTNLQGAPRLVQGKFNCGNNKLTSLQGAPVHVGTDFVADHNRDLTSLAHIPPHVGRDILVYRCALTSLAHMPDQVHGHCLVYSNKLTDLAHAPRIVQGNFSCYRNPLQSLQHAPDQIGGHFDLSWDPHMPLLRTLVAKLGVIIEGAPDQILQILNDDSLIGRGKPAAIKATAALVRAGFKANARW